MGGRAENRFRKHSREHFDRELKGKQDQIETSTMFEELQDLRSRLKIETEKNERAMSCIKRLRVRLTGAQRRTAEARADAKKEHQEMMTWLRAFNAKNRAWRKLSRLVRELCDPVEVAQWREENREADE